jgi:hypothetical protein
MIFFFFLICLMPFNFFNLLFHPYYNINKIIHIQEMSDFSVNIFIVHPITFIIGSNKNKQLQFYWLIASGIKGLVKMEIFSIF